MAVLPGDVVRVTAKMVVASEDVVNVYHWQNAGAATVSDAAVHAALASAIDTAMTYLLTWIPDTETFTTIESFNVSADAPMVEAPWPTLTVGGAILDRMPSQVAALLTFPTGTARSLGKKYLGVFSEGANDAFGQPTAALQAALASYVAEILTTVVVSGEDFVVGHYRYATFLFIRWLSGIVELVWSTQRRRKKGSGS